MRVVNEYYRKQPSKENRDGNKRGVLAELERDHRNLVKHCLNMEVEIKYSWV